jgi:uncharacterized protein (DUF2235 family)
MTLRLRLSIHQTNPHIHRTGASWNMHKNIVLFSDGTGNSSGKLFKTNVWRTYQAVDVADPQHPKEPRQFAFYDNGVGTSSFKPLAVLGGALGLGLARNVRDLYAFVCRNYEPDDRIYAFGFSRGAFTIRILIGLIMKQGLVPYKGDEAELDRLVNAAYRAYRAKGYHTIGGLMRPMRPLRDGVINAFTWLRRQRPYGKIEVIGGPESKQPIEIEFLGLWDTVDAYGLPIDELTRAVDKFIWPMTMPDLDLNKRVKRACHALALDDERNTFHPRVWNEATEPQGNSKATRIDQERISQVWFAGMHSDVGGGYPDDGLAHVSLEWIMTEATNCGLRFSEDVRKQYIALADENGPIHDSRHGLASYYRYNPRRIEKLAHQKLENNSVVEIGRSKVHESVLRRIKTGHDGYAPFVLPPGFAVMKFDGTIEDGSNIAGPQVATTDFAAQREHVWNWVWWRRVAYFFTLAATLMLVVMPLIWPALPKGACESRLCFASHGIDLVTVLLPGFTSTWTDSFSSHPDVFFEIVGLIAVGLWSGGILARRVRDSMRSLWYGMPSMAPHPGTLDGAAKAPGRLNLAIEWLRTRVAYQTFFRLLTHQLGPAGFLVAVAYGAIAMVSQGSFALRSSWGDVCAGSGALMPVESAVQATRWQTRELCKATGAELRKGATYRLHFTIPATAPWSDARVPAGPNGIDPDDVTLSMSFSVPFRRHLGQPWFKPMARIGSNGTDVYPLDPKPTVPAPLQATTGVAPGPKDTLFETEIVARTHGELFLYVNDAVLQLPFYPGSARWFYNSNHGSADVLVELVQAPSRMGENMVP